MMTIDMSPEAVTHRMLALDQLWELAVALRSSEIVNEEDEPAAEPQDSRERESSYT